MDEKGVWKLSPVYDVTFSYGPGGEHSTTYLGEGKHPTKETLVKLGKKHGLKNSDDVINEVQGVVVRWNEFAKIAKVSNKSESTIEKVLKKISNIEE